MVSAYAGEGTAAPAAAQPSDRLALLSALTGTVGTRVIWGALAGFFVVGVVRGALELTLFQGYLAYSVSNFELFTSFWGKWIWFLPVLEGMLVAAWTAAMILRHRLRTSSPIVLTPIVSLIYVVLKTGLDLVTSPKMDWWKPVYALTFAFFFALALMTAVRPGRRVGLAVGVGYFLGWFADTLLWTLIRSFTEGAPNVKIIAVDVACTALGATLYGLVLPTTARILGSKAVDEAIRNTQSTVTAPGQVSTDLPASYQRHMIVGAVFFIAGSVATVLSFQAASSSSGSGKYLVFWGAIIFGAIDFVRGLAGWEKSKNCGGPGT